VTTASGNECDASQELEGINRSAFLDKCLSPIKSGLVLMQVGKIIGAIGVSGMASDQDGVAAKASVDAIK